MAELYNESYGAVARCPGDESCDRWTNQAGSFEEKIKACIGCDRCDDKPPLKSGSKEEASEFQKQRMIGAIEKLVQRQNANLPLGEIGYLEERLLIIYREAEAEQDRLFKIRTRGIFEVMAQQ